MERETMFDIIELSRGYIGVILITILMLTGIVTATYSGDSENIILPESFDYYSIVGNSTPIDLTIIQNGLEVNITFNKYQQTDNFTIIFFNKEKEIITNTIYSGGGGGGSTKYVDRNVTIEVPKFYDRNITVYKDNNIIEDKIIFEDNTITFLNILKFFLGSVIGIIILMYVYFKLKSNERGKIKENE